MAIEKMRLLRLAGTKENIEEFVMHAFATYDLHAELASKVVNDGNGGKLLPEDNRYGDFLNRIENIISHLQSQIRCAYDGQSFFTADEIEHEIREAEHNFEKITETKLGQSRLGKEDLKAISLLREYNISDLNHTELIGIHFGKVPISALPKLDLYELNSTFTTHVLIENEYYAWILVMCMREKHTMIGEFLTSIYFEAMAVPKFDDQELSFDCESRLGRIYGFVHYKADIRKYYKYIAVFGDTYVITGFVPEKNVQYYKSLFGDLKNVVIEDKLPTREDEGHESIILKKEDEEGHVLRMKTVTTESGDVQEFIVQDFPASMEEGLEPPTVLRNGWFAKPFELFVEMYGLPHYHDFDPSLVFAITYSLLFGIMFGDLGQGFVLFLVGTFMYKKSGGQLWAIIQRISISSMFFGIIFGSVFGFEHLLDPFYQLLGFHEKPVEVMSNAFTMPLLLSAVSLGALLIFGSIGLNTILNIRHKKYGDAFFSPNGIAGLIFYGALIAGAVFEVGLGYEITNSVTITLFIVLPLVAILFHHPLENALHKMKYSPKDGWVGFFVEGIFELLEIVLSFLTNTMSFLRVGGFVLSHAGMMLVVMTLHEMTGQFGLVVVILGNIFVMGLEGLIVGIQTLRLEYNEMFSRYFEGGGKKYIPTTLLNND